VLRPPVGHAKRVHQTRLLLGASVAVAAVVTIVAAVLLWPPHPHPATPPSLAQKVDPIRGTVDSVRFYGCNAATSGGVGDFPQPSTPGPPCETALILVHGGPDKGQEVSVDQLGQPGVVTLHVGDHVLLVRGVGPSGKATYGFYDYQRSHPLALLAFVFAVVVVAVGRWRGVGALAGLALTWLVMVRFVLPAILEGRDPVAVSLVGAAIIVLVVLFIAHGVTERTATAVLGTLVSLLLVELIATVAVHATSLSGLGNEGTGFIQGFVANVRVQGLLLGGIVIGSLGVLNDITVTQASATWEIHEADPTRRFLDVYRSAMRVGRDHIASTVYTLVLAYAGAALPLLLLFTLASQPLNQVVTAENVAEEVVRALVGSIGLVMAVPLTTALAALVVTRANPSPSPLGAD
jgi:uncharacterized membrane protein